jgi:hypothetical protein
MGHALSSTSQMPFFWERAGPWALLELGLVLSPPCMGVILTKPMVSGFFTLKRVVQISHWDRPEICTYQAERNMRPSLGEEWRLVNLGPILSTIESPRHWSSSWTNKIHWFGFYLSLTHLCKVGLSCKGGRQFEHTELHQTT